MRSIACDGFFPEPPVADHEHIMRSLRHGRALIVRGEVSDGETERQARKTASAKSSEQFAVRKRRTLLWQIRSAGAMSKRHMIPFRPA